MTPIPQCSVAQRFVINRTVKIDVVVVYYKG